MPLLVHTLLALCTIAASAIVAPSLDLLPALARVMRTPYQINQNSSGKVNPSNHGANVLGGD